MNAMQYVFMVIDPNDETFRLFLDGAEAREFAQANGYDIREIAVYQASGGGWDSSNPMSLTPSQIARMHEWVPING